MFWILMNQGGSKAVQFTSMLSIKMTGKGDVVSTPIERGSFASYNKVQSPNEIVVTLAFSGDSFVRAQALATLQEMQKGTDLLCLLTPSSFHDSLTLKTHTYELKKETGVLVVILTLAEVRQLGSQLGNMVFSPSEVKNPDSASTQKNGKVQTSPAQL